MTQNLTLILASKASVDLLTPILNLAMVLPSICGRVVLITDSCSEASLHTLTSLGVQVYPTSCKYPTSSSFYRRVRGWWDFREKVWDILGAGASKSEALLWIGSGDSALALGHQVRDFSYVLQLHELYDRLPHYKHLLGYYARNAGAVVVPEFCRGAIIQCWYRLSRAPFVLPNKFLNHPQRRFQEITHPDAIRSLTNIGREDKLVIYQGAISRFRDIRPVAKAVNILGKPWRLILMGQDSDGFLAQIRAVNPDTYYVPHIPAPRHLEVTSHSHIGVASYGYDMLNAVFCAPNKIWEYSGFGIPILCNDIPGLRYTVQYAGAGECCGMENVDNIAKSLKTIDDNYHKYSEASKRFFASIDTKAIIQSIIQRALNEKCPLH